MGFDLPKPWKGIKSDVAAIVKAALAPREWMLRTLLLVIALAMVLLPAQRARARIEMGFDLNMRDADTVPPPLADEKLPDIESRKFDVKITARSTSGGIYKFEDPSGAKPAVGNIILLTRENEKVMAFRVLKNRGDKKYFLAKPIRRYEKNFVLQSGDEYIAMEIVQEKPTPQVLIAQNIDPMLQEEVDEGPLTLPANQPQTMVADAGGLDETGTAAEGAPEEALEVAEASGPRDPPPQTLAYDPELDAGSSPDGLDEGRGLASVGEDEDDVGVIGATADEIPILDPNHHWLSAGYAAIYNGDSGYASAGGVRYGLTLSKQMMFTGARVQDSLAVEAGAYLYKVIERESDAYTVFPLLGIVRYNLSLGESYGAFLYGGMLYSQVIKAANPTREGLLFYTGPRPAFGAGLLYKMGPGWELRADFGYDMIGAGLMLRF